LTNHPADEKYLIGKGDQDVEEYEKLARENAKDIIACGFNIDRTFIFSDYAYMGGDFYRNVTRISKRITRATADSSFGFTSSTNIGKVQSTFDRYGFGVPTLANRLLLDTLRCHSSGHFIRIFLP